MSDDKEAPKEDIRVTNMLAEVGKTRIESLANAAGAVDASKVFELAIKSIRSSVDATGNVQLAPVDEKGERLLMPNGEYMSVIQYISQMKADPATGFHFRDGASKPKATGRLETETNPFHRDTFNLSAQAKLLRDDPDAAKIYRDAAKGTLASNPWSAEGLNITRQSQLLRDDPALAARMKSEVQPKERNPWKAGPEFNMTMQVLILRSDKTKATRMKAEALLANGPDKPKNYLFVAPPGSFRRMGTGR